MLLQQLKLYGWFLSYYDYTREELSMVRLALVILKTVRRISVKLHV